MAKGEAVVKAESNLPAGLADLFMEQAGAGQAEDATEIQLPFIKQVQDISPERDSTAAEYVTGADSGDLFNSVTREVYKAGIEVIPASFRNTVVAFRPRKAGGGFLGEYESRQQALDHLDEVAELIDSTTVAVMYRPLGSTLPFQPAMLSLSKTKQKVARAWRTQLLSALVNVGTDAEPKMVQPPIFGTRWALQSVRASNAKGRYFNLGVRFLGAVEDVAHANAARTFGESMAQRELRQGFADDALAGDEDSSDRPSY